MKKKHYMIFLLISLLFLTTFISINPFLTTDKPLNNQISEESTNAEIKIPQFPLASAWLPNGTPVCTENNEQDLESICSDGAGGAIIVWEDNRTAYITPSGYGFDIKTNYSVYAQRINSTGDIKWDAEGVPICTITNYNYLQIQICSDEQGGAIITWVDNRSGNGDIYAQRVDSDGKPLWDINGIRVCTLSSEQWRPQIISNMGNGAIIVWIDERNGMGNPDIYAQNIDSDGDPLWWSPDGNGTEICTHSSYQHQPQVCTDGNGGAIITWYDDRAGATGLNVYAQRIDYLGNLRWSPSDGLPICTIVNTWEVSPRICSDGDYGAIIAWSDNRTGGVDIYTDIYAQRVDSDGKSLWPDNGTAVCTYEWKQRVSDIQPDGTGGAFVVWDDYRTYYATDLDVFAQKINSIGDIQWDPDGVPICTEIEEQDNSRISIDGAGGAFIVWSDERSVHTDNDIYAQYINSQGKIQWDIDGKAICNEIDYQGSPQIVSNGISGAIVIWRDSRDGNRDIYAQRVEYKLPSIIVPPSDDDDDDDDDNGEEEAIPGYNVFVLIGVLCIISIVFIHKCRH